MEGVLGGLLESPASLFKCYVHLAVVVVPAPGSTWYAVDAPCAPVELDEETLSVHLTSDAWQGKARPLTLSFLLGMFWMVL